MNAGSEGVVRLVNATLTAEQVGAGSGSATFSSDGGTLVLSGAQADLFTGFADNAVTLEAGGGTIDTQGFDVASAAVIGGSGGLTHAHWQPRPMRAAPPVRSPATWRTMARWHSTALGNLGRGYAMKGTMEFRVLF